MISCHYTALSRCRCAFCSISLALSLVSRRHIYLADVTANHTGKPYEASSGISGSRPDRVPSRVPQAAIFPCIFAHTCHHMPDTAIRYPTVATKKKDGPPPPSLDQNAVCLQTICSNWHVFDSGMLWSRLPSRDALNLL